MRRACIAAAVTVVLACGDEVDPLAALGGDERIIGLIVEEVPPPSPQCEFEVGDVDYPLTFDAGLMGSLVIPIEVTNRLPAGAGNTQQSDNTVTPLRFDFRWECESTTLASELVLPSLGLMTPFCYTGENVNFVGFDTQQSTGSAIAPGNTGVWLAPVLPEQFVDALNTGLQVAELSQACCDAAGGCDNIPQFADVPVCGELQSVFDAVAPSQFSIDEPDIVRRWLPFFPFTSAGALAGQVGQIPALPLTLRGIFEGITSAGELVVSTPLVRPVGLCRTTPGTTVPSCAPAETVSCLSL